ncbi:MAG: hypothetical protein H6727_07545 [Myxococcales bacterium]|nr:hypothetical protein [Myxococcales bacterium]
MFNQFEIEIGQLWTHKLTKLSFRVAVVEGDEVMLEPESGEGQEITLSRKLLMQEFKSSAVRRASGKSSRSIKPGKIRRGLRR